MCEIKWYSPRKGAKRERTVRKEPDVKLSTGRKTLGFNLAFSESVYSKVAPSGKVSIGIMGSRMFFKDGGEYKLGTGGHRDQERYLHISVNTEMGADGIEWINKYGKAFQLLIDEKTGLYCIDANGNTTKEA